jgi:hypothetical protein
MDRLLDLRRARALALAFTVLVLVAPAARALGLGDLEPVHFNGLGVRGANPAELAAAGLAPSFFAGPSDTLVQFGIGFTIPSVEIVAVHNRPQTNGLVPTPANPYVADVRMVIETTTWGGSVLPPLLGISRFVDYPTDEVALDVSGLAGATTIHVLEATNNGTQFFAIQFPTLATWGLRPDGVTRYNDFTLRFVIGGPMPSDIGPDCCCTPQVDLFGLATYAVPEPGTGLLLAAGLLGFVSARTNARRRSVRV